jgi:hypothetical protein
MGLRVTFTGEKTLTVVPWDVAEGLSDAWCVTAPDGRILAVATDGRVVVVDATLPISDWFGPAKRWIIQRGIDGVKHFLAAIGHAIVSTPAAGAGGRDERIDAGPRARWLRTAERG